MPAKEYDYLKDTILVTYPDGPETYGATQAAPSSGVDTSDATAVADDIRFNKTAYTATGKVTGTIEDYDGSSEPASGKSLFAQIVDRSITEVSASDLAGATKIGEYVFYNCSSLISVTIPSNITSIGELAFYRCKNMKNISIPDSVVSIGNSTFEDCNKLTDILIPNKITKIAVALFRYCSNLTNIVIPSGITNIASIAFYSCGASTESGTTYTILATTPPTIQSSTFENAKINKIIVPAGTSSAYKAATNWSALADYIEEATV